MYYKFLILMFCIVFLIGNVSATSVFDSWNNKLSYSKGENGNSDLKIELENWFGLGKNYGTAELKSHPDINYVKKVGRGKQVTMYYDFNFIELYENGLGEVEFTDERTGEEVERDYRFVYWGEEEYESPVYEEVCEISKNSTNNSLSCHNEIISYKTKIKEKWLPYDSKNIPKGNIRIGIEVEVKKNDYIDGVWDIGGKAVKKHASWKSSLETDLISWWTLDETSGTNAEDIWGTNNGTLENTEDGDWVDGIIGNGLKIDGVDERIVVPNSTSLDAVGEGSITACIWFNTTTKTAEHYLLEKSDGNNFAIHIYGPRGTTGYMKTYLKDGSNQPIIEGTTDCADGEWHHVCVVRDTTEDKLRLYVDGAEDNTEVEDTTNADMSNTANFIIGSKYNDVNYWTGTIDEVGIWNRSLSASEISDLCNLGSGTNPEQITTNSVTLNSPTDGSTDNNRTQTFNFTPEFYIGALKNCSLWTNETSWSLKKWNDTIITNGTSNIITDSFSDDGIFLWNIGCSNGTEDTFASSNSTININTIPTITVFSPSSQNYSTSTIWFNATSDLSIDTWIVNYNGTNTTLPSINSSLEVEDGDFDLNFWGNNSESGEWGLNDSISFNVDTTEPTILITSPTETYDYLYDDYNLTLNTTINDTHLDTCWYEYNGSNNTFSCTTEVLSTEYFNYSVGENSLIVWANDTYGNINSSTQTIDYKIIENSRNFTSSIFETATETYKINVTANSSLTAIKLFWNNTNHSMSNQGSGLWTYTRDMPIGTGNYTFNFSFIYDENMIKSTNSTQELRKTLFTPTNATYSDVFLNISFKDENDLSSINASISTSEFIYYLGSGSVNKTLSYSNNTNDLYFAFSGTTESEDLYVLPTVQYRQVSDYPQRIWEPSLQTYNSTQTDQILYLLSTTDGIYVTYQILDQVGDQLSGVEVTASRVVSGETVIVGTGTTDSAGVVTFWMNPDFLHTVTFEKSGYEDYTLNHFPTQATYTLTMASTTSSGINDYLRGVTYTIKPRVGRVLEGNTIYNFNLTLNSSYWDLDSFGFNLYDEDDNLIIANSSTSSSGGFVEVSENTLNYEHIKMNYYWVVNGTTTDATSGGWLIHTTTDANWSIITFFEDLSDYKDDEIFGLDTDALNLIIFIIIFVSVGMMSYKFTIRSPATISGMVFALVFFFDFGLGLISIDMGIPYFPTFFTGLIMVSLIIREAIK